MYTTCLKLIFRRFSRSRVYTVINVGGLAIAFTVALLIYGYVMKEWQTDRFHTKGETLYRATYLSQGNDMWYSAFCSPMGENAKKEIPGVREFVRIVAPQTFLVRQESTGEFWVERECIYTDPQFFSVLDFPLVEGKIGGEMPPDWVVISERAARKYFGEVSAVGKTLVLRYPQRPVDLVYHVVGVMKNMPAHSSLQADLLLDFKRVERLYKYGSGNALTTLLQLDEHADAVEIGKAIQEMEGRYSDYEKQLNKTVVLQSFRNVYLHSEHLRDYEEVFRYGSRRFNYILSGVAFLILLLASCNYLMIKLAQLHKNTGMYAIQKCFGAGNRIMRKQVYLEIGVHLLSALLLAVWLGRAVHPWFMGIVSSGHPYEWGLTVMEGVLFGGIVLLFIGVMGYLLSAWMLRRLDCNGIKNAVSRTTGKWDLKQVLLVGQMCIFCGLFFASLLLSQQMDFVQNKPMGYDNRNILCVEWPGNESVFLPAKDELLRHPDILAVTNGRSLPYKGTVSYEVCDVNQPGRKVKARLLLGDADYLATYSMHLAEGRNYRRNENQKRYYNGSGKPGEAVINRKMVRELGLENPVGKVLSYGNSTVTVVGVVDDFHYKSLYQAVEPVVLGAHLPGFDNTLNIRYREGKRQEVLDYLQKYYRDNYMGIMLQYSEYSYTDLYARDVALAKMIHILTVLAILISGMGILAFSMFVVESRRKEVAMRKINGATEWQVVGLLNRGFVRKMLGACFIGLPVAYGLMVYWLQGFAYRVEIHWWLFVLDAGICLLLVLLVSTWQTRKAALQNPVDALKEG